MEGVIKCYKEKFPEANIFTIRFPIQVFWGSITVLEVSYINQKPLKPRTDTLCHPRVRDHEFYQPRGPR
jgi:hypothetical protein